MATIAQQKNDERKDKAVAALITLGIGGLILLFLILYKIITPIPPFEDMTNPNGGGPEINFGIYNEGTGNVEGPGIGDATSVVAQSSSPTKAEEAPAKEEEFKNGEQVLENTDNTKPQIKENTTVIPVKPTKDVKKDDKSASNLLNAYTHSKSNTQQGGDGSSGHEGNEGSPEGNPNTDGKGGTGGGPTTGPGNGSGLPGTGVSLSGRQMINPPPKVSDSKEEGVVVVIITVDKDGNVIEADANGKGTNTSSATLKSKARQAAKLAKFSPSNAEIQKGTIVFRFEF